MTLTFPHPSVVSLELHGAVRGAEIEDALRTLLSHPQHTPGMNELWDLRQAQLDRFRAADLMSLAVVVSRNLDRLGRRTAIVVAREVDFGVGRMWEGYAALPAPQERRIFRDHAEALAWLTPV